MLQTRFGKFILLCLGVIFAYAAYAEGYRLYERFYPAARERRIANEESALLAGIAEKARLRAATLKEQIPTLIDKIAAGHTDPETVAVLDAAVLEWRRLNPPAAINMQELLTRNTEEDRVRYFSKLVSEIDAPRAQLVAAGASNNINLFVPALKAAALNPDTSYQFVSSQINRLRRDRLYREPFDTFKRRAELTTRRMREAAFADSASALQFIPALRDELQSFYVATREALYTYPTIIREERGESKDAANEFSQRYVKIYGEGRDGVRTKAAREARARNAIQLIEDFIGSPIARERFEMILSRIAEDIQAPSEADKRSDVTPAPAQAPVPSPGAQFAALPSAPIPQVVSLTSLKESTNAAVTQWRTVAGNDLAAGRKQGIVVKEAIRDFYKAGRAAGHTLPLTKDQEEGEGKRQGLAFQKRLAALYPVRDMSAASARVRFPAALRLIDENVGRPIAAERLDKLVMYMRSDLEYLHDDSDETVPTTARAYAPRIYNSPPYGPRGYGPIFPPFFPRVIIR